MALVEGEDVNLWMTHLVQSSNECRLSTKHNFFSKLLLTSPVAKEEQEGRGKAGERIFLYQNKFFFKE